jgi:outer membrane protein assembly factor BamB
MDREQKIQLSYRAALVSGIFCGVVALLLILNFWHMKQHEPLESQTIEALVERLKQEPNNEELKQEIRSFDLLARKAYFTSRWQVKTGTWLLLFGGIVLAFSLKVHTDLRAQIELPLEGAEDILKARANSQYWLFLTGGLILGLSLVAAFLTNDYLKEYDRLAEATPPAEPAADVEVVDVFPETLPETGTLPDNTQMAPPPAESETLAAEESSTEPEVAKTPTAQAAGTPSSGSFNPRDFKTNQATFRGYMGQGVSYHRNIPESWDGASGQNIKWKVNISKPGYNTPVIWGDRIFVSGADESTRIVACYNRHTGVLIWEKEVTGIAGSPATPPRTTEDTGLAAPTMAVDGQRVYAIFGTGDIAAFDLEGNMVWGRNLGVPDNTYGHSSSLQVWDGKLVVQYDTFKGGRMLALNTANGESIWDISRPGKISWASPTLIEVDGTIQIVTTGDPYVAGYDLHTGEEIWSVEAMMGEVAPSIAYEDGLVFATNEYARLVALEPRPGTEFVWENDEYLAEVASPVAYKGLLYIATSYGVLVCYDSRTGDKYWEKDFSEGFYSSPMVAEDKLYMMDMGGNMHIIKTDKEGTMVAQPSLDEQGFTLPVFADGRLYLRGETSLYCIE